MLTNSSMKNAAGEETIKFTRGTVVTGVGRVAPGDVHTVAASVARLCIAQGQAVPHTLERKATAPKKTKPASE
jgi:hypothetical protein